MIVPNTKENIEYIKQQFPLLEYKVSNATDFQTGIQIYDNKVTMLNITDQAYDRCSRRQADC